MKKYDSIGQLLTSYRKGRDLTQVEVAGIIPVHIKTYRRWETNANPISPDNLKDLAERLVLPFDLLLRLNYGYPAYYDIRTNHYRKSPCDFDCPLLGQKGDLYMGPDNTRIIQTISVRGDFNTIII